MYVLVLCFLKLDYNVILVFRIFIVYPQIIGDIKNGVKNAHLMKLCHNFVVLLLFDFFAIVLFGIH